MTKDFSNFFLWLHRHTAPLIVCVLLLLDACTVSVPSHIIQQQEMEDLLYDYHLMQAIAGDLGGGSNVKRKQYEQYVFDKHGVTEAEFDSSLAWYMRNTREMEKIYRKLNTRFTTQKEALAEAILPNQRVEKISEAGDTVDVWPDYRLLRLTDSPMRNRVSFTLLADSNYHVRDSFVWKMQASFLGDTARMCAVMALTLFMDKDTIGVATGIDSTGVYALNLSCDSNYVLKQMVGNIYYYNHSLPSEDADTVTHGNLLLSGVRLVRYHRPDTISSTTESLDSVTVEKKTVSEYTDGQVGQESTSKPAVKVVEKNRKILHHTQRSLMKEGGNKK